MSANTLPQQVSMGGPPKAQVSGEGFGPGGYPPMQGSLTAPAIMGDINILATTNALTIQQKVSMAEAITGGCYETENEYRVFDTHTGRVIAYVKEESNATARCLCAPEHSLMLNIIGVDQMGTPNSTLMTMEREGCFGKPCLGCPAVSGMCQDQMRLHHGLVQGDPGSVQQAQPIIGQAIVPCGGGWCTPTVEVFEGENNSSPFSIVKSTGTCPCLFGGMLELCFESHWEVNGPNGQMMAKIIKKKGKGVMGVIQEAMTDADTFTLEFTPGLNVAQRASLLGTLLLLDYMFFERDVGICEGGKLLCFNFYFMGMTCSCKFGGGGGGEGGGSDEGRPPRGPSACSCVCVFGGCVQ